MGSRFSREQPAAGAKQGNPMPSVEIEHPYAGIYASTICPMDSCGAVDESALGRHFEALVAADGLAGLLVNGHAGENAVLTEDELAAIVRVARSVAGLAKVVAGVNSENVEIAARMAKDAAKAGADAVMVFPPYSWTLGANPEVIAAHHRSVAVASGLPVFLFQASVHAGQAAFSTETLARLLEIESVVGIKEGSWETSAYERTLRLTQKLRPDVSVMASGDEHLLACFVIGSAGSLVSLAAVVPDLVVSLDRAVRAGDLTRARAVHEQLYELARLVYAPPGNMVPLRLKTCLQLLGKLSCVAMRAPVGRLPDQEVAALGIALDAAYGPVELGSAGSVSGAS